MVWYRSSRTPTCHPRAPTHHGFCLNNTAQADRDRNHLEVVAVAKEHKINEQIRVRQVRLIDDEGNQVGIIDTKDAMKMGQEKGLDLVMVSPNTVPPVCRLLDYGRFRFEAQQQEKEARKKARSQEQKSIKLRVKIGGGDFETKVNHVKRFLKEGHKVKVTIMFRGRERTHPELGEALLKRVGVTLGDAAIIEVPPMLAGMDMNMIVAPTAKAAALAVRTDLPPDTDEPDAPSVSA
jgi:translation initiation factor IF-3